MVNVGVMKIGYVWEEKKVVSWTKNPSSTKIAEDMQQRQRRRLSERQTETLKQDRMVKIAEIGVLA